MTGRMSRPTCPTPGFVVGETLRLQVARLMRHRWRSLRDIRKAMPDRSPGALASTLHTLHAHGHAEREGKGGSQDPYRYRLRDGAMGRLVKLEPEALRRAELRHRGATREPLPGVEDAAADIAVRVGRALERARKSRGWSQVDLASAAGVSWRSVYRAECGDAGSLPTSALRCLAALGLTLGIVTCASTTARANTSAKRGGTALPT